MRPLTARGFAANAVPLKLAREFQFRDTVRRERGRRHVTALACRARLWVEQVNGCGNDETSDDEANGSNSEGIERSFHRL